MRELTAKIFDFGYNEKTMKMYVLGGGAKLLEHFSTFDRSRITFNFDIKPQAIKDFYENEELIAITKELAETLRKNKTIDWQKRESARAKMRMLIKKLLKKHKYPPEGMEDAVQTVMTQCELWMDNNDMSEEKIINFRDNSISYAQSNYTPMMVAESVATYETKK